MKGNKQLFNSLETLIEDSKKELQDEMRIQSTLIEKQFKNIDKKLNEISYAIQNRHRTKRGLINGIGTIFKTLTGNLDANDGEYYSKCINKLKNDEHEIENLMKNQISVTTSTIRNFNYTLRQLKMDEETFNRDIMKIEKTIIEVSSALDLENRRIKFIEKYEEIIERNILIDNELSDIISGITFSKLSIIHPSIIEPMNLIIQLRKIVRHLKDNQLPFPPDYNELPNYFEVMELKAYQTLEEIVFILEVPLIEPFYLDLYHVYSIPIKDEKGYYHIIVPDNKYVSVSSDRSLYVNVNNLSECRKATKFVLCKDRTIQSIQKKSPCEIQLLNNPVSIPENCEQSIIFATDYKVEKIEVNTWLIAVTEKLPITITCYEGKAITEIIDKNSILKIGPLCTAYIGNSKIFGSYEKVTEFHEIIEIPNVKYECCKDLPPQINYPDLEPIQMSKLNLDELNIAQHKLNKYKESLDELINKPFIEKNISWFTYVIITVIILIIVIYISLKIKRRCPKKIGIAVGADDDPYDGGDSKNYLRRIRRSVTPRDSIRRITPVINEEIELNTNNRSKLSSN